MNKFRLQLDRIPTANVPSDVTIKSAYLLGSSDAATFIRHYGKSNRDFLETFSKPTGKVNPTGPKKK